MATLVRPCTDAAGNPIPDWEGAIALLTAKLDRGYTPATVMNPRVLQAQASQAQPISQNINPLRIGLLILNNSTGQAFIGDSNKVTTGASDPSPGFPVAAGQSLVFGREYIGPVWAIMNSTFVGSADIRYIELNMPQRGGLVRQFLQFLADRLNLDPPA